MRWVDIEHSEVLYWRGLFLTFGFTRPVPPRVCRNHILVDNEGAYFKTDDDGYCCNAFGYRTYFVRQR
mgnify:CR=1 FL=1